LNASSVGGGVCVDGEVLVLCVQDQTVSENGSIWYAGEVPLLMKASSRTVGLVRLKHLVEGDVAVEAPFAGSADVGAVASGNGSWDSSGPVAEVGNGLGKSDVVEDSGGDSVGQVAVSRSAGEVVGGSSSVCAVRVGDA